MAGISYHLRDESGFVHRLQTSIIVREQIEVSLLEQIKGEAVKITRQYAQARIGQTQSDRPSRRSGDLVRSIKGRMLRPGSAQLYTDDSEYHNGFNYAATFEYGMRKFPAYRGRHFWRDAKREIQKQFLRDARIKLATIKRLYAEGE